MHNEGESRGGLGLVDLCSGSLFGRRGVGGKEYVRDIVGEGGIFVLFLRIHFYGLRAPSRRLCGRSFRDFGCMELIDGLKKSESVKMPREETQSGEQI